MTDLDRLLQAMTLQAQTMERMISKMQELTETFDRMTDAMLEADGSDESSGVTDTYMDGTPVKQ